MFVKVSKSHESFHMLVLSPTGTKELMAWHQPLGHLEQSHPTASMSPRGLHTSTLNIAQRLTLAGRQGGVEWTFSLGLLSERKCKPAGKGHRKVAASCPHIKAGGGGQGRPHPSIPKPRPWGIVPHG